MIYLDNAATTLPYKEVIDEYLFASINNFANSSSIHKLGVLNYSNIIRIKQKILNLLKLDNNYEVIFLSSATEANNLALIGYAIKNKAKGNHLITTKIEHASILNTFKYLESIGFNVTYLDVKRDGSIDSKIFKDAITDKTILVSIMGVNNEFGNILNIEELKEILSSYKKIILHSDLAQTLYKTKFNYKLLDMMSITAHKIHGLKGTACLIKRKNINLNPLLYGGGQENNLRSSTYDYAGIVSLYKAMEISSINFNKDIIKVNELYNYLVNKLKQIEEINVHQFKNYSPFILNITLKKKKASVLVEYLSNNDIYVSSVSACSSNHFKGSYVANALGINEFEAMNTIRISLSSSNTIEELDIFIKKLKEGLESLRG